MNFTCKYRILVLIQTLSACSETFFRAAACSLCRHASAAAEILQSFICQTIVHYILYNRRRILKIRHVVTVGALLFHCFVCKIAETPSGFLFVHSLTNNPCLFLAFLLPLPLPPHILLPRLNPPREPKQCRR